jgi:hypothetical protein
LLKVDSALVMGVEGIRLHLPRAVLSAQSANNAAASSSFLILLRGIFTSSPHNSLRLVQSRQVKTEDLSVLSFP